MKTVGNVGFKVNQLVGMFQYTFVTQVATIGMDRVASQTLAYMNMAVRHQRNHNCHTNC